MRFIPEYTPARKLVLSFVDAFYQSRFHYGRAHAQILRACRGFPVEMHLAPEERQAFGRAVGEDVLALPHLSLHPDSPGTAILLEGGFIPAEDEDGRGVGLVFRSPRLEHPEAVHAFSRRLAEQNGFTPLELGFDFSTAELLVNEEVVLLSSAQFQTAGDERKLRFFRDHFPGYHYHIVPPLAGEITADLDMFLWPIAPRAWIASQYPAGSAQEESIRPSLEALASHGHTVHRVPGLEPIVRGDINTMPNYANGVLLSGLALAPAYGREEDAAVVEILRGCGFAVEAIDCSEIILSNSGIHCISMAIPAIPAIPA